MKVSVIKPILPGLGIHVVTTLPLPTVVDIVIHLDTKPTEYRNTAKHCRSWYVTSQYKVTWAAQNVVSDKLISRPSSSKNTSPLAVRPSVCMSVCLSVTPFRLWSHPHEIFNVTRDKKYPILTRIQRIWTVTPVWIRRWLLNDAQSLTESSVKFQDMQDKKSPILTRIEGFRNVTPDCNPRYALFNDYIYWITLGNKKVFWGATKFQMVLMKGIWTIKPSSLFFLLIWYLIFGQGNSQIME